MRGEHLGGPGGGAASPAILQQLRARGLVAARQLERAEHQRRLARAQLHGAPVESARLLLPLLGENGLGAQKARLA